jgi:iron complex transport system substrate-binding protein
MVGQDRASSRQRPPREGHTSPVFFGEPESMSAMAPTLARLCRTAAPLAAAIAGCVMLAAAARLHAGPLADDDGTAPRRIVSLDLCTDQLLIELGDAARIAAVTHLARDSHLSAVSEKAGALTTTRGDAEDVLAYDPDLVLAGPFGVSPTVELLRRLGRTVVVVPLAQDLAGVRRAVRAVASAIGAERRGEAMIAKFDRRLARIAAVGPRPTAIVYQIGGIASGPGSLADAALTAAGFSNLYDAYRPTRSGRVPLEALVARPPDLLVLAGYVGDDRTSVADNLRHPALAALRVWRPVLELPARSWLCGTPHIADAIERLADVRENVERAMQARTTRR